MTRMKGQKWLLACVLVALSMALSRASDEDGKLFDFITPSEWPGLRDWDPEVLALAKKVAVAPVYIGSGRSPHVVLHTEDGRTYLRGNSPHFDLGGDDDTGSIREIVQLRNTEVVDIKFGLDLYNPFIAILTSAGAVWTAGVNLAGNLGHSDHTNQKEFHKVPGLPPVSRLAVGSQHVVAITEDGSVFSWGANTYDQLGYDTNRRDQPTAREVQTISGVNALTQICSGMWQTMLLADDRVLSWGFIYYIGRRPAHGTEAWRPALVEGLEGQQIQQLSCGLTHTLALSSKGKLFGWGSNSLGTLGAAGNHQPKAELVDNSNRRVQAILAGDNLSLLDMAHEGVYYGGWYGGRGTQGLQPVPTVAHPRDMLVEAFHGASSAGAAGIERRAESTTTVAPVTDAEEDTTTMVPNLPALDQISVDGWPELSDFGSELLSQARLVAVAPYYRAEPHIVLHTEDRRTYLRGTDFVFDLAQPPNFPPVVIELEEIRNMSVKDIKLSAMSSDPFIVILTEDGTVWTMGANKYGTLGRNGMVDSPKLAPVEGLPAIEEIYVGWYHCVVRAKNNQMFSWGYNNNFQLGRETTVRINPTPGLVDLGQEATPVKDMCCGAQFCAVQTEQGVFTWGIDAILGRSSPDGRGWPAAPVVGLDGLSISQLACGDSHTIVLTEEGELYGWGSDWTGAIADAGRYNPFASKMDLGGKFVREVFTGFELTILNTDDGAFYLGYYKGDPHSTLVSVPDPTFPRDITYHGYMGARTFGAVRLVMESMTTEAGEPSTTATPNTPALDLISVDAWPELSDFGPELLSQARLVSIAPYFVVYRQEPHIVLHTEDRRTYLRANDFAFELATPPNFTPVVIELEVIRNQVVKDIKWGAHNANAFVLILTEDGTVWTMGRNKYGTLGRNGTDDSPDLAPVEGLPAIEEIYVGWYHCVVRAKNNQIYSWGYNTNFQLGFETTEFIVSTPTLVELGQDATPVKEICCGGKSCALQTEQGQVLTWGSGFELGRPSDTGREWKAGPVMGLDGLTINKLACGDSHTVVLTDTHELYGWGDNYTGAIADAGHYETFASRMDLGGKIVQDVFAAYDLTIISTDEDEVFYLGEYYTDGTSAPVPVPDQDHPRDVTAGSSWGPRTSGSVRLDITTVKPTTDAEETTTAATPNTPALDLISVDAWPELSDFGPELLSQARLVSIAPYFVVTRQEPHIVLHTEDRRTYLRANDFAFELATPPDFTPVVIELEELRNKVVKDIKWGAHNANAFVVILTEDGTLWSMGRNKYGYLGRNGTDNCPNLAPIAGLPAIEEIYVGWYHCVARTRDNQIYSWGYNPNYQLGFETTEHIIPTPTLVELEQDATPVKEICCGGLHCTLQTEQGRVLTWGWGQELGRPSETGREWQAGPVRGLDGLTITKLACGDAHTVVLTDTHELYGWGNNYTGAIANAGRYEPFASRMDLDGKIVREVIAAYDLTIINTGDEVFYLGQYYANRSSTPVPVPDPDHPRDVTAGSNWGPRTSGSVRLDTTTVEPTTDPTETTTIGNPNTPALDLISVDAWPELSDFGSELLSQARLVSIAPYFVVTRQEPHIVLHTEDRRTYLRANDFAFELATPPDFTPVVIELEEIRDKVVKDIKWGAHNANAFVVILTEDGTLWSMGRNKYGYLGRNGTDNCPNLAPIAGLPAIEEIYVGWYHCVARTRDNQIYSWGYNPNYQLGFETTEHIIPTPTLVELEQDATPVKEICCGGLHCTLQTEQGQVLTWGWGQELGRPSETGREWQAGPVMGLDGLTITKLACGDAHTVVLTDTHELYGWGNNYTGAVADAGRYEPFASRMDLDGKIVREVIAAYDLTIINTGDEVLYLGQYYANRSSTPVPVPDPDHPRDVTAGSNWGPRTSGSVRLDI